MKSVDTFAWPLDDYKKVKFMLGFMGTRLAGFLFTNFNVMLKYMQSDKADRVQRKWTCRSWPFGKFSYLGLKPSRYWKP